MKQKTIFIAAITGVCLLIPFSVSAQEAKYESSGFSADITSSGEVKNLCIGKTLFISYLSLIGDYRFALVVKDHDARFYQFQDKMACTISRPDAHTMIIQKEAAVLGNEKYSQGAVYKEKITFTPNQVSAEYEVNTEVSLDSQDNIFGTLVQVPLSFAGDGYKATDFQESETMGVIPREYSKTDSLRVIGHKVAIAIPGGVITVEGGQGTELDFTDARSWNDKNLRLDMHQQMPWHPTPVTFAPGTKFKWAFTISYEAEKK